jgi:hypothetical protein
LDFVGKNVTIAIKLKSSIRVRERWSSEVEYVLGMYKVLDSTPSKKQKTSLHNKMNFRY